MSRTTEQLHSHAKGLDALPLPVAAELLVNSQVEAAMSVNATSPVLGEAAASMAATIRCGGTLYYVAAGSSGLMAAADAMELGGTFSIPSAQIRIVMAGGLPAGPSMPGGTEDDTSDLAEIFADVTSDDTVITVSASGSTPFTVVAAELARSARATVVGIANNAGTALLELADHPVLLRTPPEVLSGSTRLGAGTAQKIVLNTLSTLMAIDLGHVHDGMMVNVLADNAKLRSRAASIVKNISGADSAVAEEALNNTSGNVKLAALLASGARSTDAAAEILIATNGHLRPALKLLAKRTT